ncbi:hypothetical protein EVAR_50339_1 [Eumeta japonica]|uniref:Uncharacterized protein n=1 Tax=Eumeta variegata TaxID=151549 RepID=A0A4C1XP58_EUMVA|nr:hypothetical protein EVAR_50339_1 [Eumeta japonica]
MLRAEAASAMERCVLPNRRLRIQISDIHFCGGEKKDPRTTTNTCHRLQFLKGLDSLVLSPLVLTSLV